MNRFVEGIIMNRRPSSDDLSAKAVDALAHAQNMPPGPERAKAIEKATNLCHASDTYNYLFSSELTPPE
jgi:hypothetical protein